MPRLSDLLDRPPRQVFRSLLARLARLGPGGTRRSEQELSSLRCVFVLSTGRTGTQTLASILNLARGVLAQHEPHPRLYALAKLSYHHAGESVAVEVLREAFLACREDLLEQARRFELVYVETSPQLTFLAPRILEVLPEARFVHLVRDPRAVVRSGMRRRWYAGNPADRSRIEPRPGSEDAGSWPSLSPFQKNLWLWNQTNAWSREFLASLPHDRGITLRSEDLFSGRQESLEWLFGLVERAVPARRAVDRVLRKRLNLQVSGDFPPPEEWSSEMRRDLRDYTADTARALGYEPGD